MDISNNIENAVIFVLRDIINQPYQNVYDNSNDYLSTLHDVSNVQDISNSYTYPLISLSRNLVFRNNIFNYINYLNSLSDNVVDNFIDSTLNTSKPVYKKIASEKALSEIKEITYSSQSLPSQNMCPIYCTTFQEGEIVCCLPCKHIFSKDGITKWLKESNICPVCRFELDYSEIKDTSTNYINNHNNYNQHYDDNEQYEDNEDYDVILQDNNDTNNNDTNNHSNNHSNNNDTNTNDSLGYYQNMLTNVNNYPSFNLVNILLQQEELEYQRAILRSLSEN